MAKRKQAGAVPDMPEAGLVRRDRGRRGVPLHEGRERSSVPVRRVVPLPGRAPDEDGAAQDAEAARPPEDVQRGHDDGGVPRRVRGSGRREGHLRLAPGDSRRPEHARGRHRPPAGGPLRVPRRVGVPDEGRHGKVRRDSSAGIRRQRQVVCGRIARRPFLRPGADEALRRRGWRLPD